MGWKIGLPSIKLNNAGVKSKNCGDLKSIAAEALKERKGHDPDIDPERAALNQYQGYQTAAELMEYSRRHVAELSEAQRAAGHRGVRKDAVVMCATILKPPAAMMHRLSQEQQAQFLNDAAEIFAEIVGRDNIKSRADHYDEQGAHTHLFWEPMTTDGRLCAKEVHSLQYFGRINKDLPAKLREKGWDIEDCRMYDAAEENYKNIKADAGRSSYEFKAQAEKDKLALQSELDTMKEEADQARQEVQELEQQIDIARIRLSGAEVAESVATSLAESARQEAEAAQEQARRAMQEADRARQIVQENAGLIQEQEDVLQLIQDYDTYLQEAQSINQDMDLLETAAKELPVSTKIFQASAAAAWMQRVEQILQDLRRLIAAGIRRLLIYERSHGVEDRLSEPAQRRAEALDVQILGAASRAGRGHQEAEKGHIQER